MFKYEVTADYLNILTGNIIERCEGVVDSILKAKELEKEVSKKTDIGYRRLLSVKICSLNS